MTGLYYRIERNRDPFNKFGKWVLETIPPQKEADFEFNNSMELYDFIDDDDEGRDIDGMTVHIKEA